MFAVKARTLLKQLHLWAGLCFGSLFVLAGLTGSVIVWMDELDHFLNPDLFKLGTMTGGMTEDLISITPDRLQATIEHLIADPRYGRPTQITIPEMANEPLVAWYRNAPSKQAFSFNLAISRQVMVNPLTLQIMGERN
jgi:uncharacterized iron-regulated membrane protein